MTVLQHDGDAFLSLVKGLGSNIGLLVFSRQNSRGGPPSLTDDTWVPRWSCPADSVTIPDLSRMLRVIDFPGIHIRKEIPWPDVEKATPESVLNDAVDALGHLDQVLVFLETH